jgi:hypothetical protein
MSLPNSRCQEGDMEHVPSTVLVWPVNLAVIWHFLIGACELIHILYVREEENCSNCAENIGYHHTKVCHLDNQTPQIFVLMSLRLLAAFACLQVDATYHMMCWEIQGLSFYWCLDVMPAAISFTCEVTCVLHSLRKLLVNCCFSILFY